MSSSVECSADNVMSPCGGSVVKTYFSYALPWALAFLIHSSAGLVDAIFIGRYAGSLALAGVNIATPFFSALFCVSIIISVGGTVSCAHALGKGDITRAQSLFTTSMLWIVVGCVSICSTMLYFVDFFVELFGATGDVVAPTRDYLQTLLILACFLPIAYALSQFARIAGAPKLASVGLALSAAINIVLDYVFIAEFGWGVKGAAWATGIGSLCITVLFLWHFLSKRSTLMFTPHLSSVRELAKSMSNGIAESVNELSIGLIMLLLNRAIMDLFGSEGVAAFTVVNYSTWAALTIAYGMSDALAPLVSNNMGANKPERVRGFFYTCCASMILIGAVLCSAFTFFPQEIANFFLPDNATDDSISSVVHGFMSTYRFMMVFAALNMGIVCFLTGLQLPRYAVSLAILRSLILPACCITLFPMLWGASGIYYAVPVAEVLTFIIGAMCIVRMPILRRTAQ